MSIARLPPVRLRNEQRGKGTKKMKRKSELFSPKKAKAENSTLAFVSVKNV